MSILSAYAQHMQQTNASIIAAGARAESLAARRSMASAIKSVEAGNFSHLVRFALEARAHPSVFAEMQVQSGIKTHNNVLANALDAAAVAWAYGSRASLTVNGAETEDPRFNAVIQHGDYDSVMNRADRGMLLHPGMAIMPTVVFDEQSGKRCFKHLVLNPGQFDREPSRHDGSTEETFTHYHPVVNAAGETVDGKTVWSALEWVRYAERQGTWVELSRGPNRYMRIPRVMVQLDDSQLWSANFGHMLLDVTVEVNVAETQLSYMMGSQVKSLVGEAPEFPPGQFLRQAGVILTGTADGMMIADFQTNVTAFRQEFITAPRDTVFNTLGIPIPEKDSALAPASGYALRMRNLVRDERAAARRVVLERAARELYWLDVEFLWHQLNTPSRVDGRDVILPIEGFDNGFVPGPGRVFQVPRPQDVLPPYVPGLHWTQQPTQYSVTVNLPAYPEDPDKEQARDTADVTSGMINRAEVYMRRHPEVTDLKEATMAVMRNLKMEAAFQAVTSFAPARERPAFAPTAAPPEGKEPKEPEEGGEDGAEPDKDTEGGLPTDEKTAGKKDGKKAGA